MSGMVIMYCKKKICVMVNKMKTISILKSLNTKQTTTFGDGNLVQDKHKNVVGLNWLMGSQHSPLIITLITYLCRYLEFD